MLIADVYLAVLLLNTILTHNHAKLTVVLTILLVVVKVVLLVMILDITHVAFLTA